MDKIIIILCTIAGLGLTFLSYPDGALSVLLILLISIPAIFLIKRFTEEQTLLINIFLVALLLRIGLGVAINLFGLENTFGPDALGYHERGQRLMEIWTGLPVPNDELTYRTLNFGSSGWGMNYLVAFIYLVFGPSMLVAQSFCGIIGALTAPMVYFCAEKIFNNRRVSKISALAIAIFPSFIIWSSQLLKDGLIIFLLVCAMTIVLQLQKKLNYATVGLLIATLFGILSLRFYIFYMVVISVAGSFIIGLGSSAKSIGRNVIVIVILGLSLTYLGVIRTAESQIDQYADLERVQYSRKALVSTADSGFGEDIDVSTPAGALAAIPIGFTYLIFAPFPWQVEKLNQVLILPEVFFWWALIPILITGLWYTIKNRLRSAIPILIFTLMLTIAYSIFQGNVGMAYRQRTQIQVFLFIFIAVGWSLIQERNENKKIKRQMREEKLRRKLKARQIGK
jgi:hypothetical protein